MPTIPLYAQIRSGALLVHSRSPAEHRFWARVNLRGPIHQRLGTRCWTWTGYAGQDGYGLLSIRGQCRVVHRYCWEMYNGPVPPGLYVCHQCDNPGCVNPRHLFLGTTADNMADKVDKGRQVKGSKVNTARLDDGLVREIRRRYVPHCRVNGQNALARRYGVAPQTIHRIIHNYCWQHLLVSPTNLTIQGAQP